MANEITKIESVVEQLDKICLEYNPIEVSLMPRIRAALITANAIASARALLTNDIVKQLILPLKDTSLGFKTDELSRIDKNKPPYAVEQVRDVAIEAVLRGFSLFGNEFNMLFGGFYAAKNGLARLVGQFPGLTDLVLVPEVAAIHPGGAVVSIRASWKLKGVPQSLERKGKEAFAVRLKEGQGSDVACGKAERKMYAAIYTFLTGSRHSIPEADADDFVEAEVAERAHFAPPQQASLPVGIPAATAVIRPQGVPAKPAQTVEAPVAAAPAATAPSATARMKARIKNKAAESPKVEVPEQAPAAVPSATPSSAATSMPPPSPAATSMPPSTATPLGPPPAAQPAAATPAPAAATPAAEKEEYPPERTTAIQAVCALVGAVDPAHPSEEITKKAVAAWTPICRAVFPKKSAKTFTGADWLAVAEYAQKLKAVKDEADPETGETQEEPAFEDVVKDGPSEPALPAGQESDVITMQREVLKRTDKSTGAIRFVVRSLSQIDYVATDKQMPILKKAQTAFERKHKMRVIYHADPNDKDVYWIDDVEELDEPAEGAPVPSPVK